MRIRLPNSFPHFGMDSLQSWNDGNGEPCLLPAEPRSGRNEGGGYDSNPGARDMSRYHEHREDWGV